MWRQNWQKRQVRPRPSSDDPSDDSPYTEEELEEGHLLVTEFKMKAWVEEVKF
jgi:hypothetical protein